MLDIVDLALARDTEAGVGALPGVGSSTWPPCSATSRTPPPREVSRAEELVAEGVEA